VKLSGYTNEQLMSAIGVLERRLDTIGKIIDEVDDRIARDSVVRTITQEEISQIYALATAKHRKI